MVANKRKITCKRIRNWLHTFMSAHVSSDAAWVQRHLANCPRCQHRLAAVGRIYLGLSSLKSQPYSLELLSRANMQTIAVLKRSLRDVPKAQKLKAIKPEPSLFEKARTYRRPIANTAACIAILLLTKAGIFSSMGGFQNQGRKVVKQYYASQIGQDLADEIFTT